ncbi:sigma-54 dependent transcriptional regulator [Massilia sp. Mn16-1_5]|uniref:sigma-54 dependent transcriptional regulator n=1 Tax=Massilia sp. Mn16-1_5 TaxID=2079199 RepID=UPI001B34B325|nr:sigma-54 dependent transcriptional regulator [Massilia sp. Mn16-1_5]
MNRKVLCIVSDDTQAQLLRQALIAWDVRSVSNFDDAQRELSDERYIVGLFVHDRRLGMSADIKTFLITNHTVEWVGVYAEAHLNKDGSQELISEHLYDYHTLPIDPVRLTYTLGHAYGRAQLYRALPQATAGRGMSAILGHSAAITRLRDHIGRAARVTAPVLIWGESGTGKELAAQAIHLKSSRVGQPFVPINCGAIAPSLIQSELFGYERGAFTGATRDKVGLIESANGGTLFLDEIGDLPNELQANLLRFLQEKTITRLGSTCAVPVDVRVIAASHVKLEQAVAKGMFRQDLYYRLSVLPLTVPALRERGDDLTLLAEHFFVTYASDKAFRLKGYSEAALKAIAEHDWPGNVRELINRVRRALVMAEGRLIRPEDLGFLSPAALTHEAELDETRLRAEQQALRECLERSSRNVSLAARRLGVSRTTMYRLLSKHNLHAAGRERPKLRQSAADEEANY